MQVGAHDLAIFAQRAIAAAIVEPHRGALQTGEGAVGRLRVLGVQREAVQHGAQ